MKLWQENCKLDPRIEKFTVGNDRLLDLKLVKYDCSASIAHSEMLHAIDVLNDDELASLKRGLEELLQLDREGAFVISEEDEDCHTAIENFLIQHCGEAGKKIHTGRSRNDQVLTALRLYEKEELEGIRHLLGVYRDALGIVADRYGETGLPGYTHTQKAMPTTVGAWVECFSDSVKDSIRLLNGVRDIVDQSPLGTAAGFGVPVLDIDRKMTADALGFAKTMENPLYAQMSRGKFEAIIIHVCLQIMFDLNKLATDLILFNTSEFGYLSLPETICTGSSIMPQKKNPDVLELIRAKYHVVLSMEFRIKSLIGNLISGYHRDFQLTKEPLFESIETTKSCLDMIAVVLQGLVFDQDACRRALTDELYATQGAYQLVQQGVPFREAYRMSAGREADRAENRGTKSR